MCDVVIKNPNAGKAIPATAPSAAFLGQFLGGHSRGNL
jgi:hypothetical protein